ncbi:MAG: precorrin-6A synthase (deacetylating) [Ilumatobacteraceae bacterium]|nr:precorrin-6A synthase (deacetylating) [Ilumatobacteraceae bacterium]
MTSAPSTIRNPSSTPGGEAERADVCNRASVPPPSSAAVGRRYVVLVESLSQPPVATRRLHVIGIGAGAVSFVTAEAAAAIADTDVFVVIDKGADKADLVGVRRESLDRFAGSKPFRVVVVEDGRRDDRLPYDEAVARWHAARVAEFERVLADEVVEGEVAGILVWGDPSLYDSTLRIIDQVNDRGRVRVEHTVLPGISSIQVLAARHRIPLNRIGGSVLITTGRRLRDGLPDGVDDVVVMLDAETSFRALLGEDFEIFWGAYLGSPDEVLISGPLDDVADEIVRVRAEARAAKGWMFDTYLLRRLSS